MSDLSLLDPFVVVLVEPQNPLNLGTVMRAMKNMGVEHLRLVNPAPMDLQRTQISAHRSTSLLERLQIYPCLDDAIADCHHTVAFTARQRTYQWPSAAPHQRCHTWLQTGQSGQRLALLFGREDSGLNNDELERCDEIVTIPTQPDYASLNLAQAVLIATYELFRAATNPLQPTPHQAPQHPKITPAPIAMRNRMLAQIAHTLSAIGYFKSTSPNSVMHRLASILARAKPSNLEAQLLIGIFAEVMKFAHLVRRGIIPEALPPPDAFAPESISAEILQQLDTEDP